MHSGADLFSLGGVKMIGILNRPDGPEKARFPAVLFLHGFPGSEKNTDIQRALMKRGVASFALHFQGAWGSEGYYLPSALVAQARAGLRFLRRQSFVDKERLALFGFSMGGWAAINTGAKEDVVAVAAVAPVGGPEMVRPETRKRVYHLCRTLRVKDREALYRDFVRSVRTQDPAKSAAALGCPLLLVHGSADEVVHPAVSERLYAAAREPKKLVRSQGAQHDFLDRREWLTKLAADWLCATLKAKRP